MQGNSKKNISEKNRYTTIKTFDIQHFFIAANIPTFQITCVLYLTTNLSQPLRHSSTIMILKYVVIKSEITTVNRVLLWTSLPY